MKKTDQRKNADFEFIFNIYGQNIRDFSKSEKEIQHITI